MKDIRSLSLLDLEKAVVDLGEKPYRAKQVFEWLWMKKAYSFDEMTSLSLDFRQKLKDQFEFKTIVEDVAQYSSDGTIKVRFRLHDGHLIESVLIPMPGDKRFTVCISTQIGCSLTCSFCATGQMDRIRNLEIFEILDQVTKVNQICEAQYQKSITNIVYMGMGEPLLNYKHVMETVRILTHPKGFGMSHNRLTISTAGIAKLIRKMADDGIRAQLALSLHAADDVKRNEIMPINEQNNLDVLMDALRYYHEATNKRITYEYILFKDFNDGPEDVKRLIKLCQDFPVIVNIIEYNPVDNVTLTKADDDQLDMFFQALVKKRIPVTIRRSRGKDIDAACGQLANKG